MGDDMMVGFSYNCEGNGCECERPKESERGSESDNNSMEIIAYGNGGRALRECIKTVWEVELQRYKR